MIYDCFLFSNELDILEIRLNELKDVVDKFILLESDTTTSGLPKRLYFNENRERFKQFSDKIIHNIYKCPTNSKDAWVREEASRNMIKEVLGVVKDDDIVIIADADEITNPTAIQSYDPKTSIIGRTLVQKLFYYRLNCFCPSYIWGWAKIVLGKTYNEMTPQQIRYSRMLNLKDGGWHFSFIGSAEMIANKIKAFAHQEYNRPDIINTEYIKKCMDAPKDIFNRPEIILQNISIDSTFPTYIQNNVENYIKAGLIG